VKIVTDVPRPVRVIEHCWIPLSDGTRLAAKIWLPTDAERDPVPALLEYLPYRKRDSTRQRDQPTHLYLAGHGYAGVRVDIRGSGDSDGILPDEYLPQEQADGVEVIAWLAAQPWCSGAVGMLGISWGGFNALQIAALQPPALKAIITVGSTDDRYATDVHYFGGCLTKDNIDWAAVMFSHVSTPPDPQIVGVGWRALWLRRLEALEPWLLPWMRHQRRDAYWQQGSVCQDFARIRIPVYAINGWADNYAESIPRLLAGLSGPRKGLIGPWAHNYPHEGQPAPAIGFLQECLRWWDHWLKGRDTGIMDEPAYRVWMQESVPPAAYYAERPGRWVAEAQWPSPRIDWRRLALNPNRLEPAAGAETPLILRSPLTTGLTAGELGRYGTGAEHATDQREDDGGSLVFTSDPLPARLEILGGPVVELVFASDKPQGLVAVRLNDVAPDGASTRVTYGVLNLAHRDSHESPAPLVPGARYTARVKLEDIAHAFPAGHRLAISVSNAYWPLVWPSPEAATLTVFAGASALLLPVRPPQPEDDDLPGFAAPEAAAATPATTLREALETNRIIGRDVLRNRTTVTIPRDSGAARLDDIDLEMEEKGAVAYALIEDDPTSAEAVTHFIMRRSRGDWRIHTESRTRQTCTATAFRIEAELQAHEGDTQVFARSWSVEIPRDNL
jgi:putative CocE/NonD family hydrolase